MSLRNKFVDVSLVYLGVYGLDPTRQNIFSKFRTLIGLVLINGLFVMLLLEALVNWKGLHTLAAMTESFSALYQVYWKILSTIYFRNDYKKALKQLDEFRLLRFQESKLPNQIRTTLKRRYFFCVLLQSAYIFSTGLYIIRPFLKYGTLPVACYQPLFLTRWPGYEAMCLLEWVHSIFTGSFALGFDLLLISMATFVCHELKLLQAELKKFNFSRKDSSNRLDDLINHHSKLLAFVKDLDTIYSIVLLQQFLASIISICMSLFIINVALHNPQVDFPSLFKTISYFASVLFELFIYCHVGSAIIHECSKISQSVYNSNWWEKYQPQLRKALRVVMLRSQKEQKITIGGMCGLELACFFRVVKAAFSFYSLMRVVYYKNTAMKN